MMYIHLVKDLVIIATIKNKRSRTTACDRHILVKNDIKAEALKDKNVKDADFGVLAKKIQPAHQIKKLEN